MLGTLSISFLLLLATPLSYSADTKTPDKPNTSISFESDISDFILVPFNGIVVATDRHKIYGYDAETEKQLWSRIAPKRNTADIKKDFMNGALGPNDLFRFNDMVRGPNFTPIPGTPFLQKIFDQRIIVINSFNGKTLFESDEKTFYYHSEYLFDEDALFLQGIEDDKYFLALYSIKQQRFLWKTPIKDQFSSSYAKFMSKLGGQAADFKTKISMTEEKIFVKFGRNFYAIDRSNGKILWKDEQGFYRQFIHSKDGSQVVLVNHPVKFKVAMLKVLGGHSLELRDGNTGKHLWKKPIKKKGVRKLEDRGDHFLVISKRGLDLYNYDTGKPLLDKTVKLGDIEQVISYGSDLLVIFDNEILLHDKFGKRKWRRSIEISDHDSDKILVLQKTSSNKLLFVSSTYANIVDYETGKRIWKRYLKFDNDVPVFAQYNKNTESVVIYNDRKLFAFSESSTRRPKRFAKVKFKSEKYIRRIDAFPDLVAITSRNEVLGVGNDGKIVYHHRYKRSKNAAAKWARIGMGKAIGKASKLVPAPSLAFPSERPIPMGFQLVQNKGANIFNKTRMSALQSAGHVVKGLPIDLAIKRYSANQDTDKYAIMVSQLKRRLGLIVKVDKETGEEVKTITLDTGHPKFDYDPYTGILYLIKGNKLEIYKGV